MLYFPVFAPIIDHITPIRIIHDAFYKMIKIQIVHTNTTFRYVWCINVNKVEVPLDIEYITIQGFITLPV